MDIQQPFQTRLINFLLDLVKTLAIVFVLSFVIRTYLIQPFIVDGSSMQPNFHTNEFIMTSKAVYHLHKPQRFDVIVFRYPNDPTTFFIKRVIGLPGETVEIKDGSVYINSQSISEPYLSKGQKTTINGDLTVSQKITLGSNELFVMGDNRDNSFDSRSWGPLKLVNVVGKYWLDIPDPVGHLVSPVSQTSR